MQRKIDLELSIKSMAAKFLNLLLLLSLSFPLPNNAVPDATKILSNSGFASMALILEFGSKSLLPQSPSLTIFTPSDSVFASSGQPSLSLLQLHFSPLSFSPKSLKSLPFNFRIPTLSPIHSLIATSPPSGDSISLNGVKVNSSAIYDDGSLIIFEIDKFFDPTFHASKSHGTRSLNCTALERNYGPLSFDEAIRALRGKGYSVMASFLELQLGGIRSQAPFTVFAPPDEAMVGYFRNFSEYSSVFFRHVVPCKLPWSVLISLDYPTVVPTFLEGYNITITLSSSLDLNKVPLVVADIYSDEWISVHGIRDILSLPEPDESSRRSMTNLNVLKVLVVFSSLFHFIFGF